jgi:hypothetical protein
MPTFEIITGRDTCNGSCQTEACDCNPLPARQPRIARVPQHLGATDPNGPARLEKMAGVLLAVVGGFTAAALLVHWICL